MKNPASFKKIWKVLGDVAQKRKEPAFIVGGFIRDWKLGLASSDMDVAVQGDGIGYGREVARALNAHVHVRHEIHKSVRLFWTYGKDRWQIDISSIQGRSIQEDLGRRDFSANAMAMAVQGSMPMKGDLLALSREALKDLQDRRLVPASDKAFQKDPVRLLRAARFVVEKNFKPSSRLAAMARRDAKYIRKATRERLCEEWWKILSLQRSHQAFHWLDEWGVLTALFPSLAVMKGVGQSAYHHLDVWDHTFEVVRLIDEWPKLVKGFPPRFVEALKTYLDREIVSRRSTRLAALKMVGVFHDISKPETKKVWPGGKITFYYHDKKGAKKARKAGEWLRLSREEIAAVERMVELHLRPGFLRLPEGGVSTKGSMKFFREAGEDVMGVLLFSLADRWAARGPLVTQKILRRARRVTREIFDIYTDQYQRLLPKKLLDGKEVMAACGIKPGPLVGRLLGEVTDAQLMKEISTKSQALDLVKKLYLELEVKGVKNA